MVYLYHLCSKKSLHWSTEDEWEKTPNQAILHILRLEMESLPRSRSEVVKLLDSVPFPKEAKEEATVVEKYRTTFPASPQLLWRIRFIWWH